MHVVRREAETPERDREVTGRAIERAADGEVTLRVWQPHRQVAFGRRDSNRDGFERARQAALDHGYAVTERRVGGHAVAFTGETVAFVLAEPVEQARRCLCERYDRVTAPLADALADLGVSATEGEPDHSFCPGTHSLSADGKLVGLAQRVRRDVAVVAGIVVVRDHEQVGTVLDPVYRALDVPFDPDSVGSIALAGGRAVPEHVADAIETRLTDAVD